MRDIDIATAAARAAGEIVAAGFGTHRTTDYKARNDPVTEVDRAAEAAITRIISEARPDDGIVGEEGTSRAGERTWLIDPLDGTVNFVHGLPQVSVSIGLYRGRDPLLGVVYDPLRDELFAAVTGGGATLNGKSIRVSTTTDPARALVVTGFPYDHHEHAAAYVATIEALLRKVNGIRRLGSAALDICYIAAGRIDAGWEYELKPWDIAAGLPILLEAGGRVTTPSGRVMTPYDRHIVSSNGALHEMLRSVVEETMPDHLRG